MTHLFTTIAAALVLASTTTTAAAALIGDSVTVRYERPAVGTLEWTDTVVVGAGAEIVCPGASPGCRGNGTGNLIAGESIDIDDLSISAVFKLGFLDEPFNGLLFEGLDFGGGDLVGFTLAATMTGLTASDISFTASSLRVNLSGTGGPVGGAFSIQLQVRENAVPEPGTVALAALSLGLLAATRRRA